MNTIILTIAHATLISQLVLLLLLLMFLASWAFMFGKWFQLKNAKKRFTTGLETFNNAGGLQKILPILEREKSFPSFWDYLSSSTRI